MSWELAGTVLKPTLEAAAALVDYQKQHPYFGIVLSGITTVLIITVFVRGMQGKMRYTETLLSLPVLFLLVIHLVSVAGSLLVQGQFDRSSYEFKYAVMIVVVDLLLAGWFVIADTDSDAVVSAISCSVLSLGLVGLSAYPWVM